MELSKGWQLTCDQKNRFSERKPLGNDPSNRRDAGNFDANEPAKIVSDFAAVHRIQEFTASFSSRRRFLVSRSSSVADGSMARPSHRTARSIWATTGQFLSTGGTSVIGPDALSWMESFRRPSPRIRLRLGNKECEVSKLSVALLLRLMFVCLPARLRAEPQHPLPMYDEAKLAVALIAASHNRGVLTFFNERTQLVT